MASVTIISGKFGNQASTFNVNSGNGVCNGTRSASFLVYAQKSNKANITIDGYAKNTGFIRRAECNLADIQITKQDIAFGVLDA